MTHYVRATIGATCALVLLGSLAACGTGGEPPLPATMPLPIPPPEPPRRAEVGSVAPLFETDRPLRLELEAPLRSVFRQRRGERTYHPARLIYDETDGERVTLDAEVMLRGKSRADADVCQFPPLELKLPPERVTDTVFGGQHKLRMVTHCQPRSSGEQVLLLEYLVYRTFMLLTDLSYRVRLAHIAYVDTERGGRRTSHYAFFTEGEEAMAARNGWQTLSRKHVPRSQLELNQLSMVEVFQYMVGNTDWSILAPPSDEDCCHNMQLIGTPGSRVIPVPYDFDFAGVVDAPYAAPDPTLRIRSVRTRLYRGLCKHAGYLDRSLDRFRARKEAIYALYRQQEGLDDRQRRRVLRYFDEFYEVIDDPEKLRRELTAKCR
jgi:hypothetical protein